MSEYVRKLSERFRELSERFTKQRTNEDIASHFDSLLENTGQRSLLVMRRNLEVAVRRLQIVLERIEFRLKQVPTTEKDNPPNQGKDLEGEAGSLPQMQVKDKPKEVTRAVPLATWYPLANNGFEQDSKKLSSEQDLGGQSDKPDLDHLLSKSPSTQQSKENRAGHGYESRIHRGNKY